MQTGPRRICFPFVGDTIGGSHVSALLLIRNLDRRYFDPVVVVHCEAGALTGLLHEMQIPFETLPLDDYVHGKEATRDRDIKTLIRNFPRLVGFLRRRRINIVHTHDFRMHLTWALTTRLAGRGVVWHQRSKSVGWKNVTIKSALYAANVIVCISKYIESQMARTPVGKKLAVIRNPFDVSSASMDRQAARQRLCAELGVPASTKVVGCVANLRPQKRSALFIEAAARIRDGLGQDSVFALFGDIYGDYVQELNALIEKLDLVGLVRFQGFRSPIEPCIAGCDLLLSPSVNEGFGRALVEAMIVGTPVIASRSGGHCEIVRDGETGILVPPDDADALAEAALQVLADEKLAEKLTKQALVYARETYSVEEHVAEMSRVYRSVQPGRFQRPDWNWQART